MTEIEKFIERKTKQLQKAKLDHKKAEAKILKLEAEIENAQESFDCYDKKKAKNQRMKNAPSIETKKNDSGFFI